MRALVYHHDTGMKEKGITVITKFWLVVSYQRVIQSESNAHYKFLIFHLPYKRILSAAEFGLDLIFHH